MTEDEAFDELDRRLNHALAKPDWQQLTPMPDAEIKRRWGEWMTRYVRLVEEAHGITERKP